jgi:predicted nucleic acid-binding protein
LTGRLLYDTSIYVSILRDAGWAAVLRPRYRRDLPRTHYSSVVAAELAAGARTERHRRQAAGLCRPFERVGRVVTPSHALWREAGAVLARLAGAGPGSRPPGRGLFQDVLIALSGRAIGARVVTRNGEDFERIRRWHDFDLEVL